MTGTAMTEAGEFHKIYNLDVIAIPTHRPIARDDQQDAKFLTAEDKFNAVIEDIKNCNHRGQPTLVGTIAVETSEYLSYLLNKQGISNMKLVVPYPVDPEKMPLYMNACDTLLLTSLHEGSPNVIKEALACNLPVVSVAVGDVPNLLEDIEGCFICNYSPEDIAAKIKLALKVDRLTNGRNKINHLNSFTIAQRLLKVYETTLERWNRSREINL